MNEVWNLERMYSGFDDPKYIADFAAFENKVAEFIAFTETLETADPLEGLRTGIRLQEELEHIGDSLSSYSYTPANCTEGKCKEYTLKAELEKEDAYIKYNRN